MTVQVNITKDILDAIQHVCTWYQGRDIDLCNKVEKWVDDTKEEKQTLFEIARIMEEHRQKEREWLAQFKEGDLYKPKEWKCNKKGQKYCEYEPYNDPACDGCVHCHQPLERK